MSTADTATDAEVLDGEVVMPDLTEREPILHRLKDAQRELLFRKLGMAPVRDGDRDVWRGPNGLSVADVAGMLEVAGMYGLDPFTPGEIWVARGRPPQNAPGQPGKLLVMVGRDGLRKVAIRNGLEIDGDVVREKDRFIVTRQADRTRTIEHSYSDGDVEKRGKVVGAWAEVYERATGRQRGYFYAPIGEYMPESPGYGSPWKAQVSAMIRKAAERQAISLATPLGGLVVDGEADRNLEDERRGSVLGSAPAPDLPQLEAGLRDDVRGVVERARELGHVGYSDVAAAQMCTHGQPDEEVARWVQEGMDALDAFERAVGDREEEPESRVTTEQEEAELRLATEIADAKEDAS